MAKKKDEQINLIDTFQEFKETKNIDRTTLVSVLEDSFRSVLQKMFGSDENFDVIVNPDKGDFEIYRNRKVVADDEVKDSNTEISLTDAQKIDADYEIGEEVSENVNFTDFGRRQWHQRFSNSSTTIFTTNMLIRSEQSLVPKFIRYGSARLCFLTMKATNCSCLRLNRFLQTFSAREKLQELSC